MKDSESPVIFPLVYLLNGQAVRPAPGGYVPLSSPGPDPVDVFDVTDRLFTKYHRLYLVDVNGKEGKDPQLDYLQEISRGQEMWVETSPGTAEEVIDTLVAGATRVVMATSDLKDLRTEVRRALALTEEIALEINLEGNRVRASDPLYQGLGPQDLISEAEEWGASTFILTSPGMGWETIADLSRSLEIYLKNLRPEEMESLRASGAAGAIMEVAHDR